MNNKTINFNCGQLIQLIGKTINFSEPLILSALRQIESENVFTFLSTINKNEIEPGSDKFPTCAKSLLVSHKIRLSARIC